MILFSERTGIVRPSDIIIKKRMTPEIQNAIANCYARFKVYMEETFSDGYGCYKKLEQYVWTDFLNQCIRGFEPYLRYHLEVCTNYVLDKDKEWYKKLDLIELTINYLRKEFSNNPEIALKFIEEINTQFKRLNFGYQVIDYNIVEITSEEEIESIQHAIDTSSANIQSHLQKALQLYAKRPEGDYRNSIKESISAVEAYCREKTGESTLGKALGAFKKKGIPLHKFFEAGLQDLYNYTNQPDTGIRHSLMDISDEYVPTEAEALFMLVTCSAFINYFNNKLA